MHPIHYSLLLNTFILAIAAALSWELREPLCLIVAMLLMNHTMGRFTNEREAVLDDDEDEDPKIGFGASIK